MEQIVETVANLGFPMGLSIYLLVRLEGKMENLSETIGKLTRAIEDFTRN